VKMTKKKGYMQQRKEGDERVKARKVRGEG
jgi:hypothetical protein